MFAFLIDGGPDKEHSGLMFKTVGAEKYSKILRTKFREINYQLYNFISASIIIMLKKRLLPDSGRKSPGLPRENRSFDSSSCS